MIRPKAFFFLDYANINRIATDYNLPLDYGHLRQYLGKNRELLDAFCYVALDPRNENKYGADLEALQRAGYFLRTKVGTYKKGSFKGNIDIELALDMVEIARDVRPDVMILGSGDGDYLPVIEKLRRWGIQVEVASFRVSIGMKLQDNANFFWDLDKYYQEYRAESLIKVK
jgi:uncharacterized LabA/DUF88 family protein